jgi:hypothetical protein
MSKHNYSKIKKILTQPKHLTYKPFLLINYLNNKILIISNNLRFNYLLQICFKISNRQASRIKDNTKNKRIMITVLDMRGMIIISKT